jgi:hypothetical protein
MSIKFSKDRSPLSSLEAGAKVGADSRRGG